MSEKDLELYRSNEKLEFYKNFYETYRIPMLQYISLREHFNEMSKEVLGPDYYNLEMDIYGADRRTCEDITWKANRSCWCKLISKLGW